MQNPDAFDVVVSADAGVSDELLAEFVSALADAQLEVENERRPSSVFAAMEWFMPTLVVLFFSRKLFDSFLSEAGKDLYRVVKAALLRLVSRTAGTAATHRAQVVVSEATPQKVSSAAPSFVSVFAKLENGDRIRFFFAGDLPAELHEQAVEEMLVLLRRHYGGASLSDLGVGMEGAIANWGTVPMLFDQSKRHWRPVTKKDMRPDV